MKKLYENIEDINIKGDVSQLSEMVSVMDIALQAIADNTDVLAGYLITYSATNHGAQYKNVVECSLRLSDELYSASENLNEMQNQIVEYQNKIYRYEEMSAAGAPPSPNPFRVSRRDFSAETDGIQFYRADMINLVKILSEYSGEVSLRVKIIIDAKNNIGNIWSDSQYNDFSTFIDEITGVIFEAIGQFDEYVQYLKEKIKELG